jgi:DNA-binding transcriptional LysR family regulator
MSIRNLKTFLAVARHGTFAAAAREIGLTQAAVSIQMRALEEEMKTELFDRSRRSVVLNTAGRSLVARAQEIVALYDGLPSGVSGGQPGGMLNVGAIPPTFARLLPDALLRLKRSYPRIDVRVVNGVSSELTMKVEHGELDAALVAEPPTKLGANLGWHPILREPLVLFTPSRMTVTSLRELLAEQPFIRVNRLSWTGRQVDAILKSHAIRVNDAMELDSLETIREMVARGLGVSILPLAESRWEDDSRVQAWRLVQPTLYRTVGLVERKAESRSQLIAALRGCLLDAPKERKAVRTRVRALSLS